MNSRSTYFFLCAGILMVNGVYAQTAAMVSSASVSKEMHSNDIKNDVRSLAKIEVLFSGSQSERFIFDETGNAIEMKHGAILRTVGSGAIEMGGRKISVAVQREHAKPEIFHTQFETSKGGKLDAVFSLQVGEEKTVSLVGGQPTKVTVKRFR